MIDIEQALMTTYLTALSKYEHVNSQAIAVADIVDAKIDKSVQQHIDQTLFRWHNSLLRLLVAWNDLNRSGLRKGSNS